MKKLVLFGDSLFGKVGRPETLMLEKALGGNYDVYNCATGGWSTVDLVRKAPFIARLQPDVVVISVGTNDAAPWREITLKDFKKNLPIIADAFEGSRIIFFPPPPISEDTQSKAKQRNNSDLHGYHDAIKSFCNARSLDYIDAWSVFESLQKRGETYHVEDGVHLSDHGYEVLFEAMREVVEA